MQFLWDGILHRVITAVQMSLEGLAGLRVCMCESVFLILQPRSLFQALLLFLSQSTSTIPDSHLCSSSNVMKSILREFL